MTVPPQFVTVREFSALVGIGERAAQLCLRGCLKGGSWRGVRLAVRVVSSRGGLSGFTYEVALGSIPAAFIVASERPFKAAVEPTETVPLAVKPLVENTSSRVAILPPVPALPPAYPRSRVTGDHRQGTWRFDQIRPIIENSRPNSPERAALVATVATTPIRDWRGRLVSISRSTLRKWIGRYQAHGFEGLMRKSRADGGKAKVLVSRRLDDTLRQRGLSDGEIARIATALRQRVRNEWRSGTPSWPTVQFNTLPTAINAVFPTGSDLPHAKLRSLCLLPRRFIEAERKYATVAMYERDAARFAAEIVPRIKRDRSHLQPMDWVAADVHHMDILFRRPDGTICTPKAVAWLDLATNRAWVDIYIMPKSKMVATPQVVQSFVNMAGDTNYGQPTKIYGDNGGEYNWMELASDLSKLKRPVEIFSTPSAGSDQGMVQRARPYNPQAKVIETLFSTLERVAIAQLPGFVGGNRMRKKTANQGKEPVPFPGDENQIREAISTAVAYYNAKPQDGHLDGQSPNDRFAQFVEAGWRSTILDPWDLVVAFCNVSVKRVQTGGTIRLTGTDYRADALQSLVGQPVLVRQPIFGDRDTLFVFSEHGTPIATAQPDTRYAFGDPHGAGEQSRREAALKADIRALRNGTERLDGQQTMAEVVAVLGPSAQAETDGVIRINPEFSEAARMARNAPANADKATRNDDNARLQKTEILKRLEEYHQARKAG